MRNYYNYLINDKNNNQKIKEKLDWLVCGSIIKKKLSKLVKYKMYDYNFLQEEKKITSCFN